MFEISQVKSFHKHSKVLHHISIIFHCCTVWKLGAHVSDSYYSSFFSLSLGAIETVRE